MKVTYLPQLLLATLAWACELYQRLTRTRVDGDVKFLTPPMMNVARQSYAFTGKKARELLGYAPIFTVDEGLQKTVAKFFETAKRDQAS